MLHYGSRCRRSATATATVVHRYHRYTWYISCTHIHVLLYTGILFWRCFNTVVYIFMYVCTHVSPPWYNVSDTHAFSTRFSLLINHLHTLTATRPIINTTTTTIKTITTTSRPLSPLWPFRPPVM